MRDDFNISCVMQDVDLSNNTPNQDIVHSLNKKLIEDYRKLKPVIRKTNEYLFWILICGIGFYVPFFAFQMGTVLTSNAEDSNTILFYSLRQYSSLALFMGIPSEIHRLATRIYTFLLSHKNSPNVDTKFIVRINIEREMNILSLKMGNFFVISYELMTTILGLILSYTFVSTQLLTQKKEVSCNSTEY